MNNQDEVKKPLFYASAAVETMMRKFKAEELPPMGRFHYHQGVFLSGVYQTYLLTGKTPYYDYVKDWVDSVINEDGTIKDYDPGQLDDIQPGILLFPIYEKTGEEKYKKVLDSLMPLILNFPKNEIGGFWHKNYYPNQMWLDGLYMAGPISVEYASRFNHPEYRSLSVEQAKLMFQYTQDEKTGLLYHAWDYSKEAKWADPVTGRSPEFWGRSIGWVPVALLDEMDFMNPEDDDYKELATRVADLLNALLPYQSEDGRWYQVVNKINEPGNWVENSCTCLYVASICKAVRKGVVPEAMLKQALEGYKGIIRSTPFEGEDIQIGNICIGTGVGDYAHYCARPTSVNDLHGVGAFLLMCAEAERVHLV